MAKSYAFVHHDHPLSMEEIRELYRGYWVYMVNAEFIEGNGVVSGRPVVIGTRAYAGSVDGIYDQFKSEEFQPSFGKSFLLNPILVQLGVQQEPENLIFESEDK